MNALSRARHSVVDALGIEVMSAREKRLLMSCFLVVALLPAVALSAHHMLNQPTGAVWNDTYVYLRAASDFVSHPTQLYDSARVQVASSWQQPAFLYPPSGLLPFLPLVPLARASGVAVAASVWTAIDVAALLAALIVLARRLGLGWPEVALMTLLVSVSQPLHYEIDAANINGVVLLLLVASLLRMPRWDAGLLMGVALAIKPLALLLLIVPVLRRRPVVSLIAVATIAALNLPFLPLIGISTAAFYVGTVLPYLLGYAVHSQNNISLANVLQTFLSGGPLPRYGAYAARVPGTLAAIVVLWVARAAVIAVWLRSALDTRLPVVVPTVVALGTLAFLGATFWPHYLVYLLPLDILLLTLRDARLRAAGWVALAALAWIGRADRLWLALLVAWAAITVHVLVTAVHRDERHPVSSIAPA